MTGKRTDVTLDDLAAEKLPAKLIAAVNEVTVEELHDWHTSTAGLRIVISKGRVQADARLRTTVRRIMIIVGGLITLGGLAFPALRPYVSTVLQMVGIT